MIDRRRTLAAVLLAALATAAVAQERPGRPGGERFNRQEQSQQGSPGRQEPNGPGVLSLLPGDATSEHSIDLPGGKLAYTATAGTFSLFDQSGE
ncbi:MAG: peptidase S10, partial [Xanthobacteraceae bacterium]